MGSPRRTEERLGGLSPPGTAWATQGRSSTSRGPEGPWLAIRGLGGSLDPCSGRRLTLAVLCLAALGPGTRQKPLQFSILDWVCGGQAGCAGQTSKPPTVGSALIAAQRTPARRGWRSPSPAAPAPVLRLLLLAAEPAITPEPHNRWRSFYGDTGSYHLLLRKIIAFGWI